MTICAKKLDLTIEITRPKLHLPLKLSKKPLIWIWTTTPRNSKILNSLWQLNREMIKQMKILMVTIPSYHICPKWGSFNRLMELNSTFHRAKSLLLLFIPGIHPLWFNAWYRPILPIILKSYSIMARRLKDYKAKIRTQQICFAWNFFKDKTTN